MTNQNLTDNERQEIIKELKDFHNELKSYKRLLKLKGRLSEREKLRETLIRKAGALKTIVIELTKRDHIQQFGHSYNIWDVGLTAHRVTSICNVALDYCIDTVNEAIGILKHDINDGKVETPKDTAEVPNYLFDRMQFHPKVVEASRSCFVAGNYREAILNAFISFIDYIKEMTELDLDGDDLMNQVFSFNYDREQKKITKYPIIRINELKNKTDRDEQHGFMFLCKGAAAFIRNPKAHKLIAQTDPLHTLEYLAFASLLFRRFDES